MVREVPGSNPARCIFSAFGFFFFFFFSFFRVVRLKAENKGINMETIFFNYVDFKKIVFVR